KSMSPTPIGRSRGHRSVGVGDSDLEAQKAHLQEACLRGIPNVPFRDMAAARKQTNSPSLKCSESLQGLHEGRERLSCVRSAERAITASGTSCRS
ncbi:MAG: hypothetical protein K2O61_03265, partial [Bacteroidaceae bacterium]|nr:hypothetical protein [Bacteroidaceae bacterium]